jgi:hypothetical protein
MSTAVGVVFDTQNPIPKLRFEFRFAKIEGRIADFAYTGLDVKVVIELTPKADRRTPSAQPLRSPQPVRATQPGIQWDYVIGAGLVVAAGVIVVATLVEDFFTAGAGIADDPASFAAAAASVARGLQLMRGAVLPLAAVPVTLNLSMKLENKNASGAVVRPRL